MRGIVVKRIQRQVSAVVSMMRARPEIKAKAYRDGVRDAKKQHVASGRPALPMVSMPKKRHMAEPLDKFRARRKASNARRREREKGK